MKDERCAVEDRGCAVEAVSPERFKLLLGSAYAADDYRRMIKVMIAGNNAKTFLAGCQATKKKLEEQLASLLEPDLAPTSPGVRIPGAGVRHLPGGVRHLPGAVELA